MKKTPLLYDEITPAWHYIMGQNFHYGYFSNGTNELSEATDVMVHKMASLIKFDGSLNVIDMGCGVGHPAIMLHKLFKCRIHGITTSAIGLAEAQKNADKQECSKWVRFSLQDATASNFHDESFNLVWMMETSHLIPDKMKLFRECYRVLEPDGNILISDIILKRELNLAEILKYKDKLSTLNNIFGKAKMNRFEDYKSFLGSSGFKKIKTRDISEDTSPTFIHWKQNAIRNKDKIIEITGKNYYDDFVAACEFLEEFNHKGILGYGFISAQKQGI